LIYTRFANRDNPPVRSPLDGTDDE
jgi:hypothetical protein